MSNYQDLLDIVMDTLPEEHPWNGNVKMLVDSLVANGVTVQKWIPVTERLPDGRSFLVTDTDGYVGEAYLREGKIYWMCDNYDDFWADVHTVDVTHWMPLPEPPKGE